MKPIHIWPQEIEIADGQVTRSARIEDREPFTLWFRAPVEHADLLCARAESFVAAAVMLAMMRGSDLSVHAPLSPSFLRNVEEFQAIWNCWDASLRRVAIEADSEEESTPAPVSRAISMFSGGVDSCYSVWRHTQNRCGRRALPLQSALMVEGFDPGHFESVFSRSRRMLAEIDVDLIRLSTNLRFVIPLSYPDRIVGSALAACLLLFQESHSHGLIPATFSYHGLFLPYGSTPLADPLFSTARFSIEHDGADFSRAGKMREIVSWPPVLENLRVCNQFGRPDDRNCGRCEKCVRNILNLRVLGIENPPCFPNALSNRQIARLHLRGANWEAMNRVLQAARAARMSNSWVGTLEKTLRCEAFYERLEPMRESVKNRLPRKARAALRAVKPRRPL